jgi:type I restriction-modification system DNA methylase subunit
MTTIISASEWLNFMWTLHNKVRNGKGSKLTGMGALNEINNFLLLFFIERNFDKYDLDDTCRFSYLYETFCSKKIINTEKNVKRDKPDNNPLYKQLHYFYCNIANMDCILRKLLKDPIIKSYLKNETIVICAYTDNVETGRTIQDIIQYMYEHFEKIATSNNKKINDLTLDDFGFDTFGDAYEKFKQQSCQDSGKTTGQHFTPVLAKDYVINELKPKDNENFYEPACGTGGFIHRAMKYLKDNNKNYKKFISNVMANECNSEIYKPLSINMLIHDIPIENIKKQDSLELAYCKEIKGTVDIIATNPPFGSGDKLDVDKYWGPLVTGKNVIKESCMAQFIMHIYHTLKPNGRCGTISDRGIISNGTDKKNSWLTKLRKFMLENMNVYKIVLLPENTFDYTTFATCILFMRKGEVTKNIEFREIKIKEINNDGQKQKVIDQDNLLGNISIEEIIKKNYSLKPDDYFKIEDSNKQDTTGWVKLGDVCEIYNGKFNSNDMDNKGNIPFYSCVANNPAGLHSLHSFNFDKYILFVSSGGSQNNICGPSIGMGKCYLVEGKTACRSNVFAFKCNDTINIKYLYYYINLIRYKICKMAKFSGNLGFINKTIIETILIPNLTQEHQEEIVKFLDDQFSKYDINKLSKQIPLFKLLINKEYDVAVELLHMVYRQMAVELLHMVYRQMAVEQELENIKRDKKALFMLSVKSVEKHCEIKNLGDICELKRGKILTLSQLIDGKYPVIGGGQKPMGYHNEYNRNSNTILISQSGSYAGYVSIYQEKVWASDCFSIEPIDITILTQKYLWYYLKYNQKNIYKLQHGNGQPHINTTDMTIFKIPVPSLDIQEEIIKRIELLEHKSSHYNQYAEILQSELNNIMEIIDNMTIACKDNDLLNDSTELNEEFNETNDELNDSTELNDESNETNDESIIDELNDKDIKELNKTTKHKSKKIQTIEYKNKIYILEDNKIYKMDDDGNKDKQYGFLIDGKIKKLKSEEKEISI